MPSRRPWTLPPSKTVTAPQSPAIYRRISLNRNHDELGVDRQEDRARHKGTERSWNVAGAVVYTDNDRSASKKDGKLPERPDFDRLCADIEAGRVDGVLAYDLDRLFREPYEAERFYLLCERAGMHRVLTVADDVDISTGDGILVARIKAAVAADEIRKMRQRVGDKQLELAGRGLPGGGGRRPFGYSCAGRHPCYDDRCDHTRCCRSIPGCPHDGLGLVPLEAAGLQNAAAYVLAGGKMEKACGMLNLVGLLTPAGNPWRPPGLARVLKSPRIAGLREYKGEIVGEAAWPAILDRATWEDLRATLAARFKYTRPYRSHLLSGIARCGREGCGAKLYAQVTSGAREGKVIYTCRRQKGGCGRLSIDGHNLEGHVCEVVEAWLRQPALAAAISAILEGDPTQDLDRLEREVAADQARLRELGREREREGWDIEEYRGMREVVVARLDANRAALAAARLRSRPTRFAGLRGEDLAAQWEHWDRATRRDLIRELVGELTVLPVGKNGRRFNSDRVRVVPAWAIDRA
jgi:DNA invertase Pin-like site-specific DNA recombinase